MLQRSGRAWQVYNESTNYDNYQHVLGTMRVKLLTYNETDKSIADFQYDNDPKYQSKSTEAWLTIESVGRIVKWLSQSPDRDPLQHARRH
ncbi:hypothetical protein BCV72DRAFT_236049 [Rhizopus microsporus var. microsporus]|uniref:Uncharacterized protein n=2 Tax=Rhizopus microsporus TaxID=58291 RepID=A0A2G4SJT9_RHIZD|nr:uncharacterized protein RHIMIDRAFT_267421 [Rhizopus microsporus ATCC 52813]ORE01636.1 hypothetical protein BCV72DRAFT_236049 [Rhizopus microsporus var. microsporus]PHZ09012.1 hypothetical protein RHIMIDRAFT_267421 [Rhizopus microsporus ATCC 52813]